MNAIKLAEVFPPGVFIKDALDDRGWTQLDLAEIMGRTHRHVNELVNGKSGVTPRTARELAAAFDTSPEFWLNLESQYQLSKSQADDDGVSRRAKLYEFPIRLMVKRGWIAGSTDIETLESEVLKFFGANSLDELRTFRHAARRTAESETLAVQFAWLYRVRRVASSFHVSGYSREALRKAVEQLALLRHEHKELRHVPRILQEAGVRFVLVEALEGSKIDGVCFWLDSRSPVIGLSLRFDRIDNFWFVLRHEIEHVAEGHGMDEEIIDTDLDGPNGATESEDEEERVANRAAAEFCVPSAKLKSFIARKQPYISEADVLGFAKVLGVHPGLVVGQIHRELGDYRFLRKHLVRVSKEILPNAVIDGWGQAAPTGLQGGSNG